jgi:predicted TIM-barrel fold metal-dependent hydrolase
MTESKKRIGPGDLLGKVTDIHAHVGLDIKAYAKGEFPYCQDLEGLYHRQALNRVDLSVVFTYSTDLYFDLPTLIRTGRMVPAAAPYAEAPYALENRMLFKEVYEYCPEHSHRFLPFVIIDPVRKVREQIRCLEGLMEQHPFYGIKVVPVGCQSRITGLLEEGEAFVDFARKWNIPFLFHVTVHPEEEYSQAADALRITEKNPGVRFCLAHCIGLDRRLLERADAAANVWVDTAALKIQVQAAHEGYPFMAKPADRYDWNYADHVSVMRELVERFPQTIVWGSDSPAYTYFSHRLQGENTFIDFKLKGTYEQEKQALDALPPHLKEKAGSLNAAAFLFGSP